VSDSSGTRRIVFRSFIMSLLSPGQIAATQKANLDTSLGLANTALEGFQTLVGLNVQAVKSMFIENQDTARNVLSVKDPQELAALQARLMQPAAEKVQFYSRQVFAIVAATQTEFAKVTEAQYEAHNRRVQALVDNLGQSAPVGSEAAVAALKSTITAANTFYETVQRTSRHAVEVAESNFNAAAAAASKATQQVVEQAARAAKK
jgi:phasin family protein